MGHPWLLICSSGPGPGLTHSDDHLTQVALFQGLPQGAVLMQALGVQVLPHSPAEQKRLLGDDS